MGKIFFGIVLLWILWGLGSIIVDKIKNSIEDRAIRKARVKETIDNTAQNILKRIGPQIMRTKDNVSAFQKMAYDKLPGLGDRISRDMLSQHLNRYNIPYKKKRKK